MPDRILAFIKKIIPKKIFKALQPAYHFTLGYVSALLCGWPSEKIIVVGVTGTTGKTTTIFLLDSILKAADLKAGYISTAMFSDGEKEWLNDKKMTLPGRFFTQRLLGKMKKNKCAIAIIETTSQSVIQFRHRFINYDILLFTGLYPEHIEAHGSFENYREAKGRLFAHLKNCSGKNINGKEIPKTIIVNVDDEHAGYFLDFWAEKKMVYGEEEIRYGERLAEKINISDIHSDDKGLRFLLDKTKISIPILGKFNVKNSLAAASVALAMGVTLLKIKKGLEGVNNIPGRLEKIDISTILGTGKARNFTVIVDYAFEPVAMAKLYEAIESIPHEKIIHLLGSAGGGRDRARRPKLGELADKNADYIIITNEDPYDEDPLKIINEVAAGIRNKKEEESFWKILDRREAIKKALTLAGEKDVVLVTGKGSEQAICVTDGKKIPWDDRKAIREVLQELKSR